MIIGVLGGGNGGQPTDAAGAASRYGHVGVTAPKIFHYDPADSDLQLADKFVADKN